MRLTASVSASNDSPIADSKDVVDELSKAFPAVMGNSTSLRDHVKEQVEQWQRRTARDLRIKFPLIAHEERLTEWQPKLRAPIDSQPVWNEAVGDFVAFSKDAGHPVNENFWLEKFHGALEKSGEEHSSQPRDADLISRTKLLQVEWQKQMDQSRSEWELKEIEQRRRLLRKNLEEFLKPLEELHNQLELLGLDPGLWLDLSAGQLTPQSMEQFKRWAQYLAQDQGVRDLCDLLGRIQQLDFSETLECVKTRTTIATRLPDISSREEVIGVRLGRDMEHVPPSELALLTDPETAILFDLKYIESGLMCFDMQGLQTIHRHIETEEERHAKEAEKFGPMVICIDTSGSMQGAPETIAKAVVLYMASKARQQKRLCYLINFSTLIETMDLGSNMSMHSLMSFLNMSFHGGTDVAPAVAHALEIMKTDDYKNADLLIVSDFIMSELPETMQTDIDAQRSKGNKFHSLVIGDSYLSKRLDILFDNEWIYNPANSTIHELTEFQRHVSS